MKKKIILGIIVLGACLSSCSTKNTAVSDLRSLSQEIATNGAEYTADEWKEVKKKYDDINAKLDKYEYTAEENVEIGRLKGQCVASFAKGVATNVKGKVVNAASQVKGIIEGIKEVFSDGGEK